jgi:hypothetical protein
MTYNNMLGVIMTSRGWASGTGSDVKASDVACFHRELAVQPPATAGNDGVLIFSCCQTIY